MTKEEGDLIWEAALDEAIGETRSSYILDYGVNGFTEEQKIYISGYNKACEDICKKLEDLRIGLKEKKDD